MSETIVKNATHETINAELRQLLRGVDILSSLPEEELDCLSGVEEIHLAEGEFIARQGDVAHHFWMLLEGELRIYQALPDGQEMTMAVIEAGTALGELPLLSNIPYMANVVTTHPSHLMQLK